MPGLTIIAGREPHHLLAVFARYKALHSLSALAKGCRAMLESHAFLDILYSPDGTGLTDDPQVFARVGQQSIGRNMMRPAAEDEPSERRYRRWRKDWRTASHDPRWYAACLFIACEHEQYSGWQTGAPGASQRLGVIWQRHGADILRAIEAHQTANDFPDQPSTEPSPESGERRDEGEKRPRESIVLARWHRWASERERGEDEVVLGRQLLYMAMLQYREQSAPKVRETANTMSINNFAQPTRARLQEGAPADAPSGALKTMRRELRDFLSSEVMELELLGDDRLKEPLPRGYSIDLSLRLEILLRMALNDTVRSSPNERVTHAYVTLTPPPSSQPAAAARRI